MRSLAPLLLLVWLLPFSAARSDSFRVRPGSTTLPRGGSEEVREYNFNVDSIGSFVGAVSTVFIKEVAPILEKESKNAAKFAKQFLEHQKENAAARRQQYQEQAGDLGKTASTLMNPMRAAKLTLSAFVMAEALQYLDGEGFRSLDEISDLAVVAADDVLFHTENFYKVGRQPGGLLRAKTWTSRRALFAAIQKQVFPKYQWAMGAAFGFVISPVMWSLGWRVFGWSAVVYAVAEGHNYIKRHNTEYFTFLKATKNPLIFFIDDILEDVREFVENVTIDPQGTLWAMREKIDSRIDLDIGCPPELQRGFLVGALVGVVAGA